VRPRDYRVGVALGRRSEAALSFVASIQTNSTLGESIMEMIKNFMQEEDGVTAIEYGLIAALIAVVIIAGTTLVGTKLNDLFTYISTELDRVTP
jgi:pilus assembly protein Flp/PilA